MRLTATATVGRPDPMRTPAPARRPIPAAVAEPVMDLVTGRPRPVTVLAVHSAAVILTCDDDDPSRVVTVLSVEGSGVPNGVRTALHAADRPFARLAVGDSGLVGGGGVRLAALELRAVRTVRTRVPRVPDERPGLDGAVTAIRDAAAAAPRGVPDAPVRRFRDALAGGGPAELLSAVTTLVGLGSGSTPGGDDVLAGALAGLHATGRTVLARHVAEAALDRVDGRTPLVSADLLRLAARGHACAEANAVLRAVAIGAEVHSAGTELHHALERLVAIGHTSGADLATGLALGLAVPDLLLRGGSPPLPPRRRAEPGGPR